MRYSVRTKVPHMQSYPYHYYEDHIKTLSTPLRTVKYNGVSEGGGGGREEGGSMKYAEVI